MRMVKYFNYNDLAISLLPDGNVVFNKDFIYRKMSSSFVMPTWIQSDVERILDNKVFRGITDVADIRKIVNSKVVELNNVLVPIARANNIKNSEISKYINFDNFFEPDDIVMIATGPFNIDAGFFDNVMIDVDRVLKKLEYKGFIISEDEKGNLIDALDRKLTVLGEKYSYWNLLNTERVEKIQEEVKYELSKDINKYLLEISTPLMMRYLLDNIAMEPYFRYDDETNSIEYDEERVFYLLDALGYVVFSNKDSIRRYLNMHINEVQREIGDIDKSNIEEETISNLSLIINLSILNRIKFISDNNIPFEVAEGIIYPDVLTSQLELETVYVDRCSEMLVYDGILEDLHLSTGVPVSDIHGYVPEMLDEVSNAFKLTKETGAHIEILYRSVVNTYMDMLERTTRRIKRDFSNIKSYPNNTNYANIMMNWTSK